MALAIEHGTDWAGHDEQRRPHTRWGGVYVQTDGDAVLGYFINQLNYSGNGLEIELFAEGAQGSEQYLGALSLTTDQNGVAIFEPAGPAAEGVHRLRLEWRAAGIQVWSNPLEVSADPNHPRMLWGQIHGHSLVSDGLGSDAEFYEFARDKSLLDFAALTDHGYLTESIVHPQFLRHQINPPQWDEYCRVCREFNDPGCFVTFLAYEWTSQVFSDKNVYFLHDDEPFSGYPVNPYDLADKYRGRNDPRYIEIEIYAPQPIVRVEIVKNAPAEPWLIFEPETPAWNPGLLTFEDNSALAGSTYYYARIFQQDGQMAWTSPIWVDLI
ncbi:MAG: DUF3604 domain-containing protein [Candidatus Alcyoniella australis]|nr:DUF3604 domain-containing protein [Candidatus Alcyoniella australis]